MSGTLIQRDEKTNKPAINRPLQSFLLWLIQHDIQVQIISSEPAEMFERLKTLGLDSRLLDEDNTIIKKSDLLRQDSVSQKHGTPKTNIGFVIDDDPLQFTYSSALVVNAKAPAFKQFLKQMDYADRSPRMHLNPS